MQVNSIAEYEHFTVNPNVGTGSHSWV